MPWHCYAGFNLLSDSWSSLRHASTHCTGDLAAYKHHPKTQSWRLLLHGAFVIIGFLLALHTAVLRQCLGSTLRITCGGSTPLLQGCLLLWRECGELTVDPLRSSCYIVVWLELLSTAWQAQLKVVCMLWAASTVSVVPRAHNLLALITAAESGAGFRLQ